MRAIFEQLEAGAVAITSTRRLSRHLLEEYGVHAYGRGKSAWAKPTVLTWDEWILHQWQRVSAEIGGNLCLTRVLDDEQELKLWEKVISRCVETNPDYTLVHSRATAVAAKETWKLIHDWCIPLSSLESALVEDTQAYHSWAVAFLEQKDRYDWITMAEISAMLQQHLPGRRWLRQARLLLVGFDALLPAQQRLVERLANANTNLEQVPLPRLGGDAVVFSCQDRMHEFAAAANWARQLLTEDAEKTIGIIVDDLSRWRDRIEAIFDQTLHGAESLSFDSDRAGVFHISLGRPLADYPVVKSALGLLELMKPSIPVAHATSLLHSPFLAAANDELTHRAGIDIELRKRGWEEVSLTGLSRLAEANGAARLGQCLRQAEALRPPATASPAGWSETFVHWLSMLGWPGQRGLSSEEYQTVKAWRELISRFARLNVVTPKIGLTQAIAQLVQMAGRRIFQPRVGPARVQIMGVLEAAGMEFSHLWISGMSGDNWPPPPRTSPFLPYRMQRDFGMPGTLADAELSRFRGLTARLLGSANRIVVSFPRQREEQVLELSPLYRNLPESTECVRIVNMAGSIAQNAPRLDTMLDDQGPVLANEELQGGASIFKDQATCGFRSFARHRLGARWAIETEPGLDPVQRGNIVHAVLAEVWTDIATSQRLAAMSESDLDRVLEAHIEQVLTAFYAWDSSPFRRQILALERHRLLALFREWMALERTRPGFKVIQIEQKISARLSGIDLHLRIDRMDETDDGRLGLIDYKTGADVKIDHWLDERPEEPQLPLYLLAYDDDVNALTFAHLRKGDCAFKGLSDFDGFAAGVEAREDWGELNSNWRHVLTHLGEQFKAGAAPLNPKKRSVCENCEVRPICRIFEGAVSPGGADG